MAGGYFERWVRWINKPQTEAELAAPHRAEGRGGPYRQTNGGRNGRAIASALKVPRGPSAV